MEHKGSWVSAFCHNASFRQYNMVTDETGDPGTDISASHSPERRGNLLCAEQTWIATSAIAPNVTYLRKVILPPHFHCDQTLSLPCISHVCQRKLISAGGKELSQIRPTRQSPRKAPSP